MESELIPNVFPQNGGQSYRIFVIRVWLSFCLVDNVDNIDKGSTSQSCDLVWFTLCLHNDDPKGELQRFDMLKIQLVQLNDGTVCHVSRVYNSLYICPGTDRLYICQARIFTQAHAESDKWQFLSESCLNHV